MKKSFVISIIFILAILIITLSGCKKKDTDLNQPVKDPVESTDSIDKDNVNIEDVMREFDKIIKNGNGPEKITKFIDENIAKLSQIEGDKMVLDLEEAIQSTLEQAKLFEVDHDGELMEIAGTELFFPENKVNDIKNEKLKDEVTRLFNNKYKLINVEGNYYPILDYEKLKQYNNYISDEVKEYIAIKAIDSNKPIALDAGLMISYDDLASRIIKIEGYISKYSEGQRYEQMLGDYRSKLSIYFSGLDNTPISEYETNKIYKDVLESYNKTANTKDSVTAFVVTKYIDVIEENKYIIDKNVKDKVLSLVNEALSLLETSK